MPSKNNKKKPGRKINWYKIFCGFVLIVFSGLNCYPSLSVKSVTYDLATALILGVGIFLFVSGLTGEKRAAPSLVSKCMLLGVTIVFVACLLISVVSPIFAVLF